MNDDVDARLRDELPDLPLPAAPDALRDYVDVLAATHPPTRAGARLRHSALLATAAMAIFAVAIGTVLLSGSLKVAAPAAVAPTASPAGTPGPSAGLRRLDAPGISFDYPSAWVDRSDVVGSPAVSGIRQIAVLASGMSLCPGIYGTFPPVTPKPGVCDTQATTPGSLVLSVFGFANPLPGEPRGTVTRTIAGYPAAGGDYHPAQPVSRAPGAPSPRPPDPTATVSWSVEAPDGGFYAFSLQAPTAEIESRVTDVEAVLATLHLSPWSYEVQAIDGRVHLDLPEGFSFEYPAGWSLYYPHIFSMGSQPVVTVSSTPLTGCTTGPDCVGLTVPPDTIVVSFDRGSASGTKWSDAPTTLAGQPAFHDWGPQTGGDTDEGGFWTVRLGQYALGIQAGIRGPDVVGLRPILDDVIASVRITAQASPAP
jgi:hypothetical protein